MTDQAALQIMTQKATLALPSDGIGRNRRAVPQNLDLNHGANPPDRGCDSVARCPNRDVRQTRSMSDAGNKTAGDFLIALSGWTTAVMELPLQQGIDIVTKFGNCQKSSMKEYDTVIPQVLVGLDQCGYPAPAVAGQKKPVVTAL